MNKRYLSEIYFETIADLLKNKTIGEIVENSNVSLSAFIKRLIKINQNCPFLRYMIADNFNYKKYKYVNGLSNEFKSALAKKDFFAASKCGKYRKGYHNLFLIFNSLNITNDISFNIDISMFKNLYLKLGRKSSSHIKASQKGESFLDWYKDNYPNNNLVLKQKEPVKKDNTKINKPIEKSTKIKQIEKSLQPNMEKDRLSKWLDEEEFEKDEEDL